MEYDENLIDDVIAINGDSMAKPTGLKRVRFVNNFPIHHDCSFYAIWIFCALANFSLCAAYGPKRALSRRRLLDAG